MLKLKKLVIVLFVMLFAVCALTNISVGEEDKVIIRCEETALYKALCEKLGEKVQKDLDTFLTLEISNEDLQRTTTLDLSNQNIKNLSGLEKFTSLTELNLNNNRISDISKLSELKELKTLNLNNNKISNISSLANLVSEDSEEAQDTEEVAGEEENKGPALTNLTAINNSITSISGLEGLTNLTIVNLSGNLITNLSGVSGWTKLEELYLFDNKISDVSSISGLESLKKLSLENNKISKISELKLPKIEELNLSKNKLEDIGFLSNFKDSDKLKILDLSNNCIKKIPDFFINSINNKKIESLDVSKQNISVVTTKENIAFLENSSDTNLLYVGYVINNEDLTTTVENGKFDEDKLEFTFEDVNKNGKIKFDNGVFEGSVITISYAGSNGKKPTTEEEGNGGTTQTPQDPNQNSNTSTTPSQQEQPSTTQTPSTQTPATQTPTTQTPAQQPNVSASKSDGTTAQGKMPYTGVTSKFLGISFLLVLLGIIVASTIYQNKRHLKQ